MSDLPRPSRPAGSDFHDSAGGRRRAPRNGRRTAALSILLLSSCGCAVVTGTAGSALTVRGRGQVVAKIEEADVIQTLVFRRRGFQLVATSQRGTQSFDQTENVSSPRIRTLNSWAEIRDGSECRGRLFTSRQEIPRADRGTDEVQSAGWTW